jgi:hypothetical protein
MAIINYWIQLENRPWDCSPHNIDRITGLDMKETTKMDPVDVSLKVLSTGATKTRTMYKPLRDPPPRRFPPYEEGRWRTAISKSAGL